MTIPSNPDLCLIYIAFGYEYFIMAANSARTAREADTRAHVKLVTNVPVLEARLNDQPLFDEIDFHDVPDDENRPFKIDLPSFTEHEFNLYLDADTEVYKPVQEVLPLLSGFDLALRTLPYPTPKKYEVLPGVITTEAMLSEYNGGAILFRQCSAVREFFQAWRRNYQEMGLGFDQPSLLRTALTTRDICIGPLGAAWNAKPTVDADLGLIRKRPNDIAILHYRDGFMWPPVGRSLARMHKAIDLTWRQRLPRVDRQMCEYEQRAKALGSRLTGYRGGRKLIDLTFALQAKLTGRDRVSLYKVMARKGRLVERTDRP